MRRFLRAIGRGMETVAFDKVFLVIIMVVGTIGLTFVSCRHLNVRPLTMEGLLIEAGSAAISYCIFFLISIIFTITSEWLQ